MAKNTTSWSGRTKTTAVWNKGTRNIVSWSATTVPPQNYLYSDPTVLYSSMLTRYNFRATNLNISSWNQSPPKNYDSWVSTDVTHQSYLYDDSTKLYDSAVRGYDYLIPIPNQLNKSSPTQWSMT